MVSNIAVVGLDRNQSYEVAKQLAGELDMLFFDAIDLFEFDNKPNTFKDMLAEFGEKYFRTKEKGMLKYASEFLNTVLHVDSGMSETLENINTIKNNCILVYLHNPLSKVKSKLEKQEYNSKEEKKFFNVTNARLEKRIERLKESSDIIISASSDSCLKLTSGIIRELKNYSKIS